MKIRKFLKAILSNIEYRELLWTNPSPTATFTAKTILNNGILNKYYKVGIQYYFSSNRYEAYTEVDKGQIGYMQIVSTTSNRTGGRTANFSDNGIAFGAGMYNGSETANGYVIPYRVYGFRKSGGVLSNIVFRITHFFERGCVVC